MFTGTSKLERVADLRKAGLNTPDSKMITSLHKLTSEIITYMRGYKKISIRTWKPTKTWDVTPHLPNMPVAMAIIQARDLLERGFHITVCPGINPAHTIMCGTVWKKTGDIYIFELAFGPGTVRRVMIDGDVEASFSNSDPQANNHIIYRVLKALKALPSHTIYEWSYYLDRNGWRKENLIFWEWLPEGKEK